MKRTYFPMIFHVVVLYSCGECLVMLLCMYTPGRLKNLPASVGIEPATFAWFASRYKHCIIISFTIPNHNRRSV
jgi:hypothetical protein